ncbi:hypothetical protein [Pedobacter agri]|uniref:hypothetical protein n=1 Tax=Pedobacter agri TaxID=454586 RepID=UPI002931DCD2|nr:hypothetical protein [Pedobacter agri]
MILKELSFGSAVFCVSLPIITGITVAANFLAVSALMPKPANLSVKLPAACCVTAEPSALPELKISAKPPTFPDAS